jgi:putative transposase
MGHHHHARPRGPLGSRPGPARFRAQGSNQLWVADITYVPTDAGFLYIAVVLDAWSRRVIGWAMATLLRTALVLTALDMALAQRRPHGVIHHSDHGCQYTAVAYGERCLAAGVRPSMGSVGDAYDNALYESFFATLECELLDREQFRTPGEARRAVFDYIEGWYNPRRRHSALGYESPLHYERSHAVPTHEVMVGEKPRAVQPPGSTIAPGGAIWVSPKIDPRTRLVIRDRP